jgi:hypothetical protein
MYFVFACPSCNGGDFFVQVVSTTWYVWDLHHIASVSVIFTDNVVSYLTQEREVPCCVVSFVQVPAYKWPNTKGWQHRICERAASKYSAGYVASHGVAGRARSPINESISLCISNSMYGKAYIYMFQHSYKFSLMTNNCFAIYR